VYAKPQASLGGFFFRSDTSTVFLEGLPHMHTIASFVLLPGSQSLMSSAVAVDRVGAND
jgi:hypothetical protein